MGNRKEKNPLSLVQEEPICEIEKVSEGNSGAFYRAKGPYGWYPFSVNFLAETEKEPSSIWGTWKSSRGIENFLKSTNAFFAEHSKATGKSVGKIGLTVQMRNEYLRFSDEDYPIAIKSLTNGAEIGALSRELESAHVKNGGVKFTWSPKDTTFQYAPNSFRNKKGLVESMSKFYKVNGSSADTDAFKKLLQTVLSEKFSITPKK